MGLVLGELRVGVGLGEGGKGNGTRWGRRGGKTLQRRAVSLKQNWGVRCGGGEGGGIDAVEGGGGGGGGAAGGEGMGMGMGGGGLVQK